MMDVSTFMMYNMSIGNEKNVPTDLVLLCSYTLSAFAVGRKVLTSLKGRREHCEVQYVASAMYRSRLHLYRR